MRRTRYFVMSIFPQVVADAVAVVVSITEDADRGWAGWRRAMVAQPF